MELELVVTRLAFAQVPFGVPSALGGVDGAVVLRAEPVLQVMTASRVRPRDEHEHHDHDHCHRDDDPDPPVHDCLP
jgi:hypothetical protein